MPVSMSTDQQVKLLKVICACAFPVLVVLGSELTEQEFWLWKNAAFMIATVCAAVWFMLREKRLSRYRGRWMVARVGVSAALLPLVLVMMSRPPGGSLVDVQYRDVALLAMIVALGVLFVYRAYLLRARQLQA